MNEVPAVDQMLLDRIAKIAALESNERHDYLPNNAEDAAQFEPHEWVRVAMQKAYLMGRDMGASGLRDELCALIGVRR